MARSKRRRKQKSPVGFWMLEAIGVLAFAFVLMNAQAAREADANQEKSEPNQVSMVQHDGTAELGGWENHRPRFSQVVGDIWNGGF